MLTNGTFLGSRYEIIDKIGAGGMSNVYKAKDHSLGREVAIKVLKSEFADDSSFVTKFKAEAQSAASLEHPNIVNIYDVGSEDGNYYIVMEYVEGITLKTYINKKGHLGYNEVLSIAIQVGRGIEAAHNKGIVHRDIKPQNIIISKEGKVKVTDFGIARAATSNTVHSDLMGSVHYSSPEQARNGFVNYQSDIYSLGIVMYEMSTGRVPFDGDTTVAVAIQHLQSEMTPPSQIVPDVPIAVERIIMKATMKSPDRRYETIGDLLTDLKKALVNPDENFVIIPEVGETDKTKVILPEELTKIQAAAAATTAAAAVSAAAASEPAAPVREPVKREEPQPLDEEEEEEEGGVSRKLDKIINVVGIIVAVIIVLILVYVAGSIFGVFKFGPAKDDSKAKEEEVVTEEEPEGIEVPDLVGMTETEAKKALKNMGLGFDVIGEMASDDYEEGQICEQDPVGGDVVEENTTIKVKVSSGAGDVEIPKVTGAKLEDAVETLRKAGFDYNPTYEYSDSVPQGQVISQSPEAGESGKKGDTVTLTVSQGVETMQVPDVRGKTQKEAKSALEGAHLVLGNVTTEESESVEEGKVISQSENPGNYLNAGASVDIVVSKGAAKKYYSFTMDVEPIDDIETYVVLKDANGNTVGSWKVSYEMEINAKDIETPTGTLYYYDNADHNTQLAGSEEVEFDQQ